MRVSQLFLTTLKEAPADAELPSHRLMLRSGLIRQIGSGLYAFLPLGLRILKRIKAIVCEEMNEIGAQEVSMPCVQPADLWKKTGRWTEFGPQMLKIKDRNKRDYCFGPTHEEVVTELVRQDVRSHKQLPLILYQVTTKFRDEIRPRFGIMRAREFVMKDAYSFDKDEESMSRSYQKVFSAYHRIFDRIGIDYRVVEADTGSIGGHCSHEFHAIAQCGEDILVYAENSSYAANRELAVCSYPERKEEDAVPLPLLEEGASDQLTVSCSVFRAQEALFLLVLSKDDEINDVKVSRLPFFSSGYAVLSHDDIEKEWGCRQEFLGPYQIDKKVTVLLDEKLKTGGAVVCGANKEDFLWRSIDLVRDLGNAHFFDLRQVCPGDQATDGSGPLSFCRGIEIGHVFQLGCKYSHIMDCSFLSEEQKKTDMFMGCYGIGISRIIAAIIEQNHDDRGIIWPRALSPFDLIIVPIGENKDKSVSSSAESIYQEVSSHMSVLYDDRLLSPGVKLSDADLIGIPDQIIVSSRTLSEQCVEYRDRRSRTSVLVPCSEVLSYLLALLKQG